MYAIKRATAPARGPVAEQPVQAGADLRGQARGGAEGVSGGTRGVHRHQPPGTGPAADTDGTAQLVVRLDNSAPAASRRSRAYWRPANWRTSTLTST